MTTQIRRLGISTRVLGIVAIIFGVLIILEPAILAWLVAIFLIIMGAIWLSGG